MLEATIKNIPDRGTILENAYADEVFIEDTF